MITPKSPGAFALSTTFHALVVGVSLLLTIDSCQREKEKPRVLELVAGEGDNFMATEAPKLGTPGGLKIDIPSIPEPKRLPEPEPERTSPPPEPRTVTPPPEPQVTPAPAPTPPPKVTPAPKKEPDVIPNFKKQIQQKVWRADANAKREIAKKRAEEAKRIKKEEFDRMQKAKVASAKQGSSAARVSKIDAEGIAKGVVGGSANNKTGGAGGRALTATDGAVTERYFAMLKERVRLAIDKPPGVSDDLTATVVVRISANGRLSNARIVKSSGSEEFDQAVLAAFGRVTMPEHPERKSEDLEMDFRTKDAGQG